MLRRAARQAVRIICRRAWRLLRLVTRTGVVPGGVWKRMPAEAVFDLPLPGGARLTYHGSYGDAIARALCWRGLRGFEPESLRVWMALSRHAPVVLDVGAHTGIYSLLTAALNPDARVLAFEPLLSAIGLLRANLASNACGVRVQVVEAAAGDECTVVQFHRPFGMLPTSASLSPSGFRGVKGELIPVRMVTVDSIAGTLPVALGKIDVEFFEPHVLRGMRLLLQRERPALLIECHPDGPYAAVQELLAPHGYSFVHIMVDGSLRELETIDPALPGAARNVLCVAQPKWKSETLIDSGQPLASLLRQ
jgi:FkbM family methyltransferase